VKTKKELPYTSQLKGVAALLSNQSGAYDDEVQEIRTNSIPISLINLPPSQPRHYFDEQKLYELARSIEKFGVLEPLLFLEKGACEPLKLPNSQKYPLTFLTSTTIPPLKSVSSKTFNAKTSTQSKKRVR
jgi:ParB-like nuclease domain